MNCILHIVLDFILSFSLESVSTPFKSISLFWPPCVPLLIQIHVIVNNCLLTWTNARSSNSDGLNELTPFSLIQPKSNLTILNTKFNHFYLIFLWNDLAKASLKIINNKIKSNIRLFLLFLITKQTWILLLLPSFGLFSFSLYLNIASQKWTR